MMHNILRNEQRNSKKILYFYVNWFGVVFKKNFELDISEF